VNHPEAESLLKIVVTDPIMSRHLDLLRATVTSPADWLVCDFGQGELLELVPEVDIYVGFHFTAEMASMAQSLKLLQVSGAGVERIALEALPPAVLVANTYHHERSIAEYVLMVMLALARQLIPSDRHLRQGVWDNVWFNPALPPYHTLRQQRLGLIGFGHIGAEIARLVRSFDMQIVAVKRRPDSDLAAQHEVDWIGGPDALPRLLKISDFVVVAAPLTDQTRGLLGREQLALMKPTAYLINIGRGPIVDERALYSALEAQKIAGAALDVWYNYAPLEGKPMLPATMPFHQLDNVIMTPHSSGITAETFRRRAEDVVDNINRFIQHRPLRHLVQPKQ
jgi:phosphoglycerate dehydrogenase-like enzyme